MSDATESHLERAASIADRLQDEDQTWASARYMPEEHPWFGAMLTQLVLAVGDSDILYMTSSFRTSPKVGVDAYIFTANLLILMTGDGTSFNDIVAKVRVVGWNVVREIVIDGGNNVFAKNDRARTWPGRIRATATLDSGEVVKLPLGIPTAQHAGLLAEFLPALFARMQNG